jgi:GNAT superfamily N-acetyltransferase
LANTNAGDFTAGHSIVSDVPSRRIHAMTRITADRASTISPRREPQVTLSTCRALGEADRTAITAVFLALDHGGRYQRFGRIMTDTAVADYSRHLNFSITRVIGRFEGAVLIGFAEISLSNASGAPCDAVLTVIPSRQRQGVGTALLKAAIAAVHALQQSQLSVIFQGSDRRMRDLVVALQGAPQCWTGTEELTVRVVMTRCSEPLHVVAAHGGDVAVGIAWHRQTAP